MPLCKVTNLTALAWLQICSGSNETETGSFQKNKNKKIQRQKDSNCALEQLYDNQRCTVLIPEYPVLLFG